ncbi:MAG: DUF4258 domain-containing protein [Actinomycetota bacterium]|nr:DUF4258 domain-containing protein [Actinomycetota bacterium]
MTRRKVWRSPVVLTQHVFDKVRSIDMTLAEFRALLDNGEIIEERSLAAGSLHELILIIDWRRPLHVVVVVDDNVGEERILTVYEPEPVLWSPDFRRRKP